MSRRLLQWLLGLLLCSGGLLAQAQTTVEYIHTDALGSVVAVTNEAGQVIERFDYEPYGAIIGQPNYGGVGFTGHVQDAATGLTYMQQRYYDPQSGVFLSVDPVTALNNPIGMFNRYRYAANNPYKFTDPDGRAPRGCGDGSCERRDWRSIAGRSPGSANNLRITSVNAQSARNTVAPSGAKTFGPLRGDYVPATNNLKFAPKGRSHSHSQSGTTQIGFVLNGTLGPIAGTVGAGVATDAKGNVALYTEWGGGGGPAVDANAGITFQGTNGRTISDLAGPSLNGSIGGGLGPHASADGMTASTADGRTILGGGTTLGGGAGAGGSITVTQTAIYPIFGDAKE